MAEATETAAVTAVEIRLRNGDTIKARVREGEAPDIDELQRRLQESEFVRIGDDTIVRSADVQLLQLRESGTGGLFDSLMQRVGGGDDGRGEEAGGGQEDRSWSGPARPHVGGAETKPFFLTSEFVLALAAWIGLVITTAASDSVDARSFWLLTVVIVAFYGVSRGFAKAHTPSDAWDPREDLVSPPS